MGKSEHPDLASPRSSLVNPELATIQELRSSSSRDEKEGSSELSPLAALHKKGSKFFGSNSSLAMIYKGSRRGRSLSVPFVQRGLGEKRSETCKIFLYMMSVTVSGLYCKFLIVLGIAFPVAEVLDNRVPTFYFEAYYLYLYLVSMLYLIFVYSTLLKQRAVDTVLNSTAAKISAGNVENGGIDSSATINEQQIGRYGSFYLRMGVVAFGIGSMIYSGLEFGQYFERSALPQCSDLLMAITPLIRMAFIIIQLQFIFISDKQKSLTEYKIISKFGLMHMIATNVCVWLATAVQETKHDIFSFYNSSNNAKELLDLPIFLWPSRGFTNNDSSLLDHNKTSDLTSQIVTRLHQGLQRPHELYECRRANIMGSMVQSTAPFLFPFTIEYSFICSVILYALWKNVCSKNPRVNHTGAFANKLPKPITGMTSEHFTVDCANAHKGLFASIIVLVFTIISLIMFFVLIKEQKYIKTAIYEVNICELTLYTVGVMATFAAMYKIRKLKYEKTRQIELDLILLVTAQSGLYIYFTFSLIASYFAVDVTKKPYVFLTSTTGIFQSTVQTMFIVDAWWRRCTNSQDGKEKPARQLVTFLLVSNVAMWAINHLENSRSEFHPIEIKFYGVWAWSIITQISMPLAVFYRFHSTVCLCEIWKCTYKMRILQP